MRSKPDLSPLPLVQAVRALTGGTSCGRVITMTRGQWDALLASAYQQGWILLELDDGERPVRAFQRVTE